MAPWTPFLVGLLYALGASSTPYQDSIRRSSSYEIGTIVNTTSGPVKGHPSALRPEVSEYLGIRFAQPPVGDLRFAPPQPVEASSSIINADSWVFSIIRTKQNKKKKIESLLIHFLGTVRLQILAVRTIFLTRGQRLPLQSCSDQASLSCRARR